MSAYGSRGMFCIIGLVLFAMLSPASPSVAGESGAFMRYESGPKAGDSLHGAVVNAARVSVDRRQLEQGLDHLIFELPSGESILAIKSGLERRGEGDLAWRGWIGGEGEGRVILTLKHGLVAGLILGRDTVYELSPDGEGFGILKELDPSLSEPDEGVFHPRFH